jgi:hypothetical protein
MLSKLQDNYTQSNKGEMSTQTSSGATVKIPAQYISKSFGNYSSCFPEDL